MSNAVTLLTRLSGLGKARDEVVRRVGSFESILDDDSGARDLINEISLCEKLQKRCDRSFVTLEEQCETRDNTWRKAANMAGALYLALEGYASKVHPHVCLSLTTITRLIAVSFESSKRIKRFLGTREIDSVQLEDVRGMFAHNYFQYFMNYATAHMDHFEKTAFLLHCFTQCRREIIAAGIVLPELISSDAEATALVATTATAGGSMVRQKSNDSPLLPTPPSISTQQWTYFSRLCASIKAFEHYPAEISKSYPKWIKFLASEEESTLDSIPETSRGKPPPFHQLLISKYLSSHFASHAAEFLRMCSADVLDMPDPWTDIVGAFTPTNPNGFIVFERDGGVDPWIEIGRIGKRTNNLAVHMNIEEYETTVDILIRLQRYSPDDFPQPYRGLYIYVNVGEFTPSWAERIHSVLNVLEDQRNGLRLPMKLWIVVNDTAEIPNSVLSRCVSLRFSNSNEYKSDFQRLSKRVEEDTVCIRDDDKRADAYDYVVRMVAYHAALYNAERFGLWRQVFPIRITDHDMEMAATLARHMQSRGTGHVGLLHIATLMVYSPRCLSGFDAYRRACLATEMLTGKKGCPTQVLVPKPTGQEQASPPDDITTLVCAPPAVFRNRVEVMRRDRMLGLLSVRDHRALSITFRSDVTPLEAELRQEPANIRNPSGYLLHFIRKQLKTMAEGHPLGSWRIGTLVPLKVAEMPDPAGFLSAILWEHCAKLGAMATEYVFEGLKMLKPPAYIDNGVLISGSYMVGIDLEDDGSLFLAETGKTIVISLPVLWLRPVARKDARTCFNPSTFVISAIPEVPLLLCDHIPNGDASDFVEPLTTICTVSCHKTDADIDWFRNAQSIILPRKGRAM